LEKREITPSSRGGAGGRGVALHDQGAARAEVLPCESQRDPNALENNERQTSSIPNPEDHPAQHVSIKHVDGAAPISHRRVGETGTEHHTDPARD